MNYILFDGASRNALLPFTYTRPVAEIRVGILTIKEKWEHLLGCTVTYLTEEYLEQKYPIVEFSENVYIDASILPSEAFAEEVSFLSENQAIITNDEVAAFYSGESQEEIDFNTYELIDFSEELLRIEQLADIFSNNYKAIEMDYELLTQNRKSQEISVTNNIIGADQVFIEEGAVLEYATINANEGPVYIGKDSLIMEGVMIRGPFSLGEKSVVKMGAKIYGGTTVGPNCTVGGEIKNVMFFGNSNKGHDGYLGNSVIGEWCNLGADTNCSNMKNNHSFVKVWSYDEEEFVDSGAQFCGVFLGDYTKIGINTMLNTGTVIGISSNVFGAGFPNKFIPSFSWGAAEFTEEYLLNKAILDAEKMCVLKKNQLQEKDKAILNSVFEVSKKYRE